MHIYVPAGFGFWWHIVVFWYRLESIFLFRSVVSASLLFWLICPHPFSLSLHSCVIYINFPSYRITLISKFGFPATMHFDSSNKKEKKTDDTDAFDPNRAEQGYSWNVWEIKVAGLGHDIWLALGSRTECSREWNRSLLTPPTRAETRGAAQYP